MTAVLLKLIEQLNSSVFILLGLSVLVVFATYRLGGLMQKFTHQDDKIKGLSTLSEKVIKIETKIDLIYQNTNRNSPIMSHSPISLTTIGLEISADIKAESILEKYAPRLISEVEKENPKNAYDIQMASMSVAKNSMIKLLNEAELISVKQEAYNKGIIVEDVMSVFGVLLRNKILTIKGLPISDVDLHENK